MASNGFRWVPLGSVGFRWSDLNLGPFGTIWEIRSDFFLTPSSLHFHTQNILKMVKQQQRKSGGTRKVGKITGDFSSWANLEAIFAGIAGDGEGLMGLFEDCIKVDLARAQAERAEALAEHLKAQANLAGARADLAGAQAELAEAQAELAEIDAELAELDELDEIAK